MFYHLAIASKFYTDYILKFSLYLGHFEGILLFSIYLSIFALTHLKINKALQYISKYERARTLFINFFLLNPLFSMIQLPYCFKIDFTFMPLYIKCIHWFGEDWSQTNKFSHGCFLCLVIFCTVRFKKFLQ